MKSDLFFSNVVANSFYVSDEENVRVDHYDTELGFYIYWSYAGHLQSKYIDLCNIVDIINVLCIWFNPDSSAVKAWKKVHEVCCDMKKRK